MQNSIRKGWNKSLTAKTKPFLHNSNNPILSQSKAYEMLYFLSTLNSERYDYPETLGLHCQNRDAQEEAPLYPGAMRAQKTRTAFP